MQSMRDIRTGISTYVYSNPNNKEQGRPPLRARRRTGPSTGHNKSLAVRTHPSPCERTDYPLTAEHTLDSCAPAYRNVCTGATRACANCCPFCACGFCGLCLRSDAIASCASWALLRSGLRHSARAHRRTSRSTRYDHVSVQFNLLACRRCQWLQLYGLVARYHALMCAPSRPVQDCKQNCFH